MPKIPPFSQIRDGLPLWSVETDDPQGAQSHPADLHLRRLSLPGGEVLALALRIYDVKGRPQLQHLAGPLARPEVAAWARALRQAGKAGLLLYRTGWGTEFERSVSAAPAELALLDAPPLPSPDPESAIRLYLDRYREAFPRLHQPEAVWDLLAAPPPPPKKAAWAWLVLALLAAGAAAWYLL